ncbi:hypothetical protein [Modestobacter excelsi]|uniref:hypothetical protein n=1 Tax=Modestobacter excelsi TaxID=2213161 RepID=UPI00110CF8AC|nr:hypothetical protein [Modestobacter excelsi]
MSRMSRPRAVVATGLTLGTATAGLFFAPAALAAETLPAPTAPASVVAGTEFQVSGTDCTTVDPTDPAVVAIVSDADTDNIDEAVFGDYTDEDGTWSITVSFPADTVAGPHELIAACGTEYGEQVTPYPVVAISVTAPGTAAPAPTTPAPSVVGSTDPAANTAGTGSTTSAATATPGAKITKVFTGFQPFEHVTLVLHSDPVVLGEFDADANGVVTATFTLPAGTAIGTHHLVLDGDAGTHYSETIVVAAGTTTASSGSLAYTGANVGLPLALGAGLLVAGGGALVVTRRRAARTTQA